MRKSNRLLWGIGIEAVAICLFAAFFAASGIGIFQKDPGQETTGTITDAKDFIKWVDFDVPADAMNQAYCIDKETYETECHIDWIDLLAVLGAKYGGDFSAYKDSDLKAVSEALIKGEKTIEDYKEQLSSFAYYQEAYGAVLGNMVGEYKDSTGKTQYGLKAYHPIAKGFPYEEYDDFGASRSYGYKRKHLGHDMLGQVGTPIIAVESGKVTALGWNQYGGWRIGIESFDGLRYYYYAHLRQNRPYAEGLKEGDIVQAGDVIGYLGRTGYSAKENVNNIEVYHLHFGLQLIFDESQREGNGEIWIDVYELVKFLKQNRSAVERNDETKEWTSVDGICDIEKNEKKQERENTKKENIREENTKKEDGKDEK